MQLLFPTVAFIGPVILDLFLFFAARFRTDST
jgi:hypothetical protein